MYRYPFTPYPNSWFRVAFSGQVTAGKIHSVEYLGQKIVLLRNQGGVHALSAICPHLGADLSAGGRLIDGQLECPFHGWRFDSSGACTQIPYCQRIPGAARLRSWPVREVNGTVFLFHHAGGAAPHFAIPEIPELASGGWSRAHRLRWRVRMHVQEIVENAVDFGHFAQVHAYLEYPSNGALAVDGHSFRASLETKRRVLGRIGATTVQITYHGLGCAVARIRSKPAELIALLTPTPIDEQYLDISLWVYFKKTNNPFRDLLISTFLPGDIRRDLEKDIPIWEHKRYLEQPLMCGGDGPIMKIRRWARQFYGAPATPTAIVPLRLGTDG